MSRIKKAKLLEQSRAIQNQSRNNREEVFAETSKPKASPPHFAFHSTKSRNDSCDLMGRNQACQTTQDLTSVPFPLSQYYIIKNKQRQNKQQERRGQLSQSLNQLNIKKRIPQSISKYGFTTFKEVELRELQQTRMQERMAHTNQLRSKLLDKIRKKSQGSLANESAEVSNFKEKLASQWWSDLKQLQQSENEQARKDFIIDTKFAQRKQERVRSIKHSQYASQWNCYKSSSYFTCGIKNQRGHLFRYLLQGELDIDDAASLE